MTRNRELSAGLLGILLIWFVVWAGPVVKLESPSVKTVEISGYAYHRQAIVMSCLGGQSSSHKIISGYFSIDYVGEGTCAGMDFTIKSDYSVVPATQLVARGQGQWRRNCAWVAGMN
jgi:hypothetical protein